MAKEIIDIQSSKLELDNFSTDELNEMLEHLCTTQKKSSTMEYLSEWSFSRGPPVFPLLLYIVAATLANGIANGLANGIDNGKANGIVNGKPKGIDSDIAKNIANVITKGKANGRGGQTGGNFGNQFQECFSKKLKFFYVFRFFQKKPKTYQMHLTGQK